MQNNEFSVNTEDCPLCLSSLAIELWNGDDDGDDNSASYGDILDELGNMDCAEFKNKHPEIYNKYFIDKVIQSLHIIIYYHFPLFAEISKIYVSQDGFSIVEIATIIQNQYKKFYKNREMAIKNNLTPKYIPIDAYDLSSLCLRFHIHHKPLNLKIHEPHPQCSFHINLQSLPIIIVHCDT
jgi:hypothetical protein